MTTIATFQQMGRNDLVKEQMEKIDMIRKMAKDYSEDLNTELSFQLPRAKVSFFGECTKMQLITSQNFNIQTCFSQFLWFFSLKC